MLGSVRQPFVHTNAPSRREAGWHIGDMGLGVRTPEFSPGCTLGKLFPSLSSGRCGGACFPWGGGECECVRRHLVQSPAPAKASILELYDVSLCGNKCARHCPGARSTREMPRASLLSPGYKEYQEREAWDNRGVGGDQPRLGMVPQEGVFPCTHGRATPWL